MYPPVQGHLKLDNYQERYIAVRKAHDILMIDGHEMFHQKYSVTLNSKVSKKKMATKSMSKDKKNDDEVKEKKSRGRPKKIKSEDSAVEKKPRGRPKKSKLTDENIEKTLPKSIKPVKNTAKVTSKKAEIKINEKINPIGDLDPYETLTWEKDAEILSKNTGKVVKVTDTEYLHLDRLNEQDLEDINTIKDLEKIAKER